jgi:hypothetical protein
LIVADIRRSSVRVADLAAAHRAVGTDMMVPRSTPIVRRRWSRSGNPYVRYPKTTDMTFENRSTLGTSNKKYPIRERTMQNVKEYLL